MRPGSNPIDRTNLRLIGDRELSLVSSPPLPYRTHRISMTSPFSIGSSSLWRSWTEGIVSFHSHFSPTDPPNWITPALDGPAAHSGCGSAAVAAAAALKLWLSRAFWAWAIILELTRSWASIAWRKRPSFPLSLFLYLNVRAQAEIRVQPSLSYHWDQTADWG